MCSLDYFFTRNTTNFFIVTIFLTIHLYICNLHIYEHRPPQGSNSIFYTKYHLFLCPDMEFGDIFFCPVCQSAYLSVEKNFYLGHNFWTVRERNFIFGMHTHRIKPNQMTSRSMTLWPWPWHLTYIKNYFNLYHYFWTSRVRVFIMKMCIPCDKAFLLIPKFLT